MPHNAVAFSLLDALSETGFQASVISTYTCYFPFYEEVILRRLLDRGCANNILMVDAGMCAAACSEESTAPRRAGRDYTLIPVHVPGAFHPKLIAAVGKSKGVLFVGSHNTTLSGFGLNDELTNEFRVGGVFGRHAAGLIRDSLSYLQGFIPTSLPDLGAIFASLKHNIPWLGGPASLGSTDRVLLTTTGRDRDLWGQIAPLIPKRPSLAFVSGPFFDADLKFLQQLREDISPSQLVVGIDPESAVMDPSAVQRFSDSAFVNISGCAQVPNRREGATRYSHSKILLFRGSGWELLVTGSANPSAAAFLPGEGRRNAEAVVIDKREGAASALGLDSLIGAPPLASEHWTRVNARFEERKKERIEHAASMMLAVPSEHGFLLERQLGPDVPLKAEAVNGTSLGQVVTGADGSSVMAEPRLRDQIHWFRGCLSANHDLQIMVHRSDEVRRKIGGSRQRELRQALGGLDEDPAQLDALLKITEKVIFDDDLSVADDRIRARVAAKVEDQPSVAPESLAIEAKGKQRPATKHRLASGDILVLLDALMHRLGEGLPRTDSARRISDPLPGDEDPGDDGEDPPPPPPPYEILAEACRQKVGSLVRRMVKQLDRAKTSVAHRAVVQIAGVLGLIQALRRIEQRAEWRSRRLKLVHTKDEWRLLDAGAMALFWTNKSLAQRAIEELDGDLFEELTLATGLLAWLAWDTGLDVKAAVERTSPLAPDEDDPWYPIQVFAAVAPHLAVDREAVETLKRAAKQTPRRGVSSDAWLAVHVGLADRLLEVATAPDRVVQPPQSPNPGDLAVLGSRLDPRIRVVLRVIGSGNTDKITVFDDATETRDRQFVATHIGYVPWWDKDPQHNRTLRIATGTR